MAGTTKQTMKLAIKKSRPEIDVPVDHAFSLCEWAGSVYAANKLVIIRVLRRFLPYRLPHCSGAVPGEVTLPSRTSGPGHRPLLQIPSCVVCFPAVGCVFCDRRMVLSWSGNH